MAFWKRRKRPLPTPVNTSTDARRAFLAEWENQLRNLSADARTHFRAGDPRNDLCRVCWEQGRWSKRVKHAGALLCPRCDKRDDLTSEPDTEPK